MVVMAIREEVLSEIEAFLARTNMPPSLFGTKVANDGKFVFRLRSGGSMQAETIDRVRDFISANTEAAEADQQ